MVPCFPSFCILAMNLLADFELSHFFHNFPDLDKFELMLRFKLHKIVHGKVFHSVCRVFLMTQIIFGFQLPELISFLSYNLGSC